MSVHKDKRNNTWYVKYQNQTKRGFKYKRDAIACEAEMRLLEKNGDSRVMLYTVIDEYLRNKKTEVQYTSYVKYEENARRCGGRLTGGCACLRCESVQRCADEPLGL